MTSAYPSSFTQVNGYRGLDSHMWRESHTMYWNPSPLKKTQFFIWRWRIVLPPETDRSSHEQVTYIYVSLPLPRGQHQDTYTRPTYVPIQKLIVMLVEEEDYSFWNTSKRALTLVAKKRGGNLGSLIILAGGVEPLTSRTSRTSIVKKNKNSTFVLLFLKVKTHR